jgi:hypothetical protein
MEKLAVRRMLRQPLNLEGVERFVMPLTLVAETIELLRKPGRGGYEAIALWGGKLDADQGRFEFSAVYFPEQTARRGDNGLVVLVDGEELFRVNRTFYEEGLILGGQVHTHPTRAYHSDTDDIYPLMTLLGGLSGVVPSFASQGIDGLTRWAWYRLVGQGAWTQLDPDKLLIFA